MANVVKHTLKYQEQRRTMLLNAHAKDDYGRHRGQVLYGMRLTPTGPNTVTIGSGALYTSLGTRLFWDVAGTPPVLDLSTAAALSGLPSAHLPLIVAVVARVNLAGADRPFAMESAADSSLATVSFVARRVTVSRASGQPTLRLLPLSPVEMNTEQGVEYDSVHTWDAPSAAASAPPPSQTADVASLQNNEILLGYVAVGSAPGEATHPTAYAVASGPVYVWSPGVTYVPMRNPHEAVADMLGIDPLLGRIADRITSGQGAGGVTRRAARQTAMAERVGANENGYHLQAPLFGSTAPTSDPAAPWAGDWTTYRWPSFLRDGDNIVDALRRMDYVMRLWMNRTGDQLLIEATQDTNIAAVSDGIAGPLGYQATLAQLLRHFDGNTTSTTGSSRNRNGMGWGTPGAEGSTAAANNHVIVDGPAVHDPASTAGGGDSHRTAIAAMDWLAYHMLEEVLGFGTDGRARPTKAEMRGSGAWPAAMKRHNEGPVRGGVDSGALADKTATNCYVYGPYSETATLGSEGLYSALGRLANRSWQGSSENCVYNGDFDLDGAGAAWSENTNWSMQFLSWQSFADQGPFMVATFRILTGNPYSDLTYLIPGGATFDDMVAAHGGLVSASVQVKGPATCSAQLIVVTWNGVTTHRGIESQQITLDPSRFQAISIAGEVPIGPAGAATHTNVYVRFRGPVDADVQVATLWAGAGVPRLPASGYMAKSFLSRRGGSANAMRGPLHLPTGTTTAPEAVRADRALTIDGIETAGAANYNAAAKRITNGSAGVAASDFAITSQVTTASAAAAAAQSTANTALANAATAQGTANAASSAVAKALTTDGLNPGAGLHYNAAGRRITNGAAGVANTDFVLMNQLVAYGFGFAPNIWTSEVSTGGSLLTVYVANMTHVRMYARGANGGTGGDAVDGATRLGADGGPGGELNMAFRLEAGDEILAAVGQRGYDAPDNPGNGRGAGGGGGGGATYIRIRRSGVTIFEALLGGGGGGGGASGDTPDSNDRGGTGGVGAGSSAATAGETAPFSTAGGAAGSWVVGSTYTTLGLTGAAGGGSTWGGNGIVGAPGFRTLYTPPAVSRLLGYMLQTSPDSIPATVLVPGGDGYVVLAGFDPTVPQPIIDPI